jgi:hypothetical protein
MPSGLLQYVTGTKLFIKKKTMTKLLVSVFIVLALSACKYDNEEDLYSVSNSCDTNNVTYSGDIAPVFSANCNSCHGGIAPSGNVNTDSHASLVANIARIRGAINHESGYMEMPQNGAKLPACDLTKIDIWIRQGMPDN